MALFDVFVVVDWSANSTPKSGVDSIWVGSLDVASGAVDAVNHPTRRAAERSLLGLLCDAVGRRVLVGYDFPLGWPGGFAADWSTLWDRLVQEIVDDDRNRNNRFEVATCMNAAVGPGPGPFWGCPVSQVSAVLDTHKRHRFPVDGPSGPLDEHRLTERRLIASGRRPLSVWQLMYAGSVGSQALVGVPVVARLVRDPALAARSVVWPFATGLTTDPTGGRHDAIVHAEVWPSAFDLDRTRHLVKDAAQVLGLCERLATLDREGRLGRWFAPDLTPDEAALVLRAEGWILGA